MLFLYLGGVGVEGSSCRKVLRGELSVELTLSLSCLSNTGHLDYKYLQKYLEMRLKIRHCQIYGYDNQVAQRLWFQK